MSICLIQVCLRPCGQYLALVVPGLAEGRPSVMIGDKILLSCPVDPGGPRYEGFVHEVSSLVTHSISCANELILERCFISNKETFKIVFIAK